MHQPPPPWLIRELWPNATIFLSASVVSQIMWPSLLTTFLHQLGFCITGLLSNETIHALEITHQLSPPWLIRELWPNATIFLSASVVSQIMWPSLLTTFLHQLGFCITGLLSNETIHALEITHQLSPPWLIRELWPNATIFLSASVVSQIMCPSLFTTFLHQLGFCITGSMGNQHQSSSPSNLRWMGNTLLIKENKYSERKRLKLI